MIYAQMWIIAKTVGYLLWLTLFKSCCGVDPFSDDIPYSIKWSGPMIENLDASNTIQNSEAGHDMQQRVISLKMRTGSNELYDCRFTETIETSDEKPKSEYHGPTAIELLLMFAERISCSYRVETYWTYELCHATHLRQFHEARDPASSTGVSVQQQYMLGHYNKRLSEKEDSRPKTVVLEGTSYPYLEVVFDEGTPCDLTATKRRTVVQYICHDNGRGDLYEIKETSTCEYTAVVLIGDLCQHPSYQPSVVPSQEINCYALAGAPTKPDAQLELEHLQLLAAPPSLVKDTRVSSPKSVVFETKEQQEKRRTDLSKETDQSILQQFLNGDLCLQGGSGWWIHEFCFGKYAKQFHVEQGRRLSEIVLGYWDANNHLDWLQKNPDKRPKPASKRRYISLFLTGGNICDENGKHRTVEVRLKCLTSGSAHAISIYLLEPELCEYILTIESPILCDPIMKADENGLITL